VIADIDEDVRIVPRAAFIKTPTGQVIANRSFEGMSQKGVNTSTYLWRDKKNPFYWSDLL